jgi:CubicO group peptidase (beta-lactamase class C family)
MELKKLLSAIFLLPILLGLTNCKKHGNDIVYNKKYIDAIKKARKDFSFYLTSNSIPGGSIAISKGGEIIYSEGMGLASKDLTVPATRATKFRIGSVSELFTSLAYQLLVENGTLDPDSSVQHYLPGFPEKGHKITLENLVNNTSGIRNEYSGERYQTNFNINIQKGLGKFKDDSLIAEPGYYQYFSPFNYNLLGAVMEKATQKSFEKVIQELITDTLNLGNTTIDNPFITINGRSDFYDHNIVALTINAISIDYRSQAPSKGLLSNAEDLAKFGNAFLYSGYISGDIKNKVFKPVGLKSGFTAESTNGWLILRDTYNRKIYARTGHVIGGGATILLFPEEELVVAIAINATMDIQEPPDYKIATYFLPEPKKPGQQETEKADSTANSK